MPNYSHHTSSSSCLALPARVKLVRLLVWRHLREERILSGLSVIGVALGLALFVGVRIAADQTLEAFAADIRGLDSRAAHVVQDPAGVEFDEEIYPRLFEISGRIIPFLKTTVVFPGRADSAALLGVPLFEAAGLLESAPDWDLRDPAMFEALAAVILPAELAARLGLSVGDSIEAVVYDRREILVIAGIVKSDALPPETILMDIGNFQEAFGRVGVLSGIDILDGESVSDLRAALPPSLVIDSKARLIQNQDSLLSAFRYNLQFLSFIAILVGLFLLYNTVFLTVVKRRTEIGILRGLGASRWLVAAVFALQGVILGAAGSVIGIALGRLIAGVAVGAVEATVTSMYSPVRVSQAGLSMADAAMALGLGIAASLAAALVPAIEAARIRPNESAREGSFEGRYKPWQRGMAAGGGGLIMLGVALAWGDHRFAPFDFPWLASAGVAVLILGFTLISPLYLRLVLWVLRGPVRVLFRATGRIALNDMSGQLIRFSVALMSVAISGALIVAMTVLIVSFRTTFVTWIDANLLADVYIKPEVCESNFCFAAMSPEVLNIVRAMPEVAGAQRFRPLRGEVMGEDVTLAFGEMQVVRDFDPKRFIDRADHDAGLAEMIEQPGVAITDYLAIKKNLRRGDTLVIPTPSGAREFTIVGTFRNYSSAAGVVFLDRRWMEEYWERDDYATLSLNLRAGVDAEEFLPLLREALGPNMALELMNQAELKRRAIAVFDQSFAITWAIEGIAIIVSLIGILNTLLAFVFERQREISVIRYLGGTWRQIRHTLMIAAGIGGLAGIGLGAVLGAVMSLIFVKVINRMSFGWVVELSLPTGLLAVLMAGLYACILVAAMLPAHAAQRIDPRRFIAFE